LPIINPVIGAKYGLELGSFIIENVSVPPEVEAAIDKRSSMAAVGNLNDYVKYQMAQGMAEGGANVGGVGAEMAVGFAIAKEMMNQTGGILGQASPAAGAPAGSAGSAAGAAGTGAAAAQAQAIPQLLTPADAATALGVAEADVIASLESGDLKGKRIGSQWRITRAALNEFLQ
jgi:excisionase family DNA binding protein